MVSLPAFKPAMYMLRALSNVAEPKVELSSRSCGTLMGLRRWVL